MPEQKKGQNWTAGLKKTSEAGGRGVVRRGKGAEERAGAQLIWTLAMEGFSGKPTIASRRGDRDPVSPWQAVPSFSGRQFRPFVPGWPLPFEGPKEPWLPAAPYRPFGLRETPTRGMWPADGRAPVSSQSC